MPFRATQEDGRRAFAAFCARPCYAEFLGPFEIAPDDAAKFFISADNVGRDDWVKGWMVARYAAEHQKNAQTT